MGSGEREKKHDTKRYQWAGPFQLGFKVTDWVPRVVQGPDLPHYSLCSDLPIVSFLESLPSSNLLLPTKQAPLQALIRQARAGRPQEVLCSPILFLLLPISSRSSHPQFPDPSLPSSRTVLLAVSCLHGNNRGQALGEEASGKCSFLWLPWV